MRDNPLWAQPSLPSAFHAVDIGPPVIFAGSIGVAVVIVTLALAFAIIRGSCCASDPAAYTLDLIRRLTAVLRSVFGRRGT